MQIRKGLASIIEESKYFDKIAEFISVIQKTFGDTDEELFGDHHAHMDNHIKRPVNNTYKAKLEKSSISRLFLPMTPRILIQAITPISIDNSPSQLKIDHLAKGYMIQFGCEPNKLKSSNFYIIICNNEERIAVTSQEDFSKFKDFCNFCRKYDPDALHQLNLLNHLIHIVDPVSEPTQSNTTSLRHAG